MLAVDAEAIRVNLGAEALLTLEWQLDLKFVYDVLLIVLLRLAHSLLTNVALQIGMTFLHGTVPRKIICVKVVFRRKALNMELLSSRNNNSADMSSVLEKTLLHRTDLFAILILVPMIAHDSFKSKRMIDSV